MATAHQVIESGKSEFYQFLGVKWGDVNDKILQESSKLALLNSECLKGEVMLFLFNS